MAIPFLQWNVDEIEDADGNTVRGEQFQGFDVRAIPPTFVIVTPKKLFGANYGVMVAPPTTIRPERVFESVEPDDWGFNDLYVVPLYLGWHTPRADFIAGYGFFAPTGRYEGGLQRAKDRRRLWPRLLPAEQAIERQRLRSPVNSSAIDYRPDPKTTPIDRSTGLYGVP